MAAVPSASIRHRLTSSSDPRTPQLIGSVVDVQAIGEEQAGTPILVVDVRGEELLIPLAEDICKRIDVVGRRIEVVLPEGLRDLNS